MNHSFSVLIALGIFLSLFYNNCAKSGDWASNNLTGVELVEETLRFSEDGMVKVFLEFDSKPTTEEIQSKVGGSTVKDEILSILDTNMQSKLSKTGRDSVARVYKYINFIATTIDKTTLDQLKQSGLIKSFTIQRKFKLFMSESNQLTKVDTLHSVGIKGRGVTVAVVDSGVQVNHPALRNNMVGGACFANDCGSSGKIGLEHGGSCSGCSHGTHVAGIIAGNSGSLQGVAPEAGIYSVRIFSGSGEESIEEGLISALEHIISKAAQHNIVAVNLSLGTTSYGAISKYQCMIDSPQWTEIFEKLHDAGIVAFVASGNDQRNYEVASPACQPMAVPIGSSNTDDIDPLIDSNLCRSAGGADSISCYSNQANWLEFVAPGRNIKSSVDGSSYDTKSGTSMATPNVAGMFAALKSLNKSRNNVDVLGAMRYSGKIVYDQRVKANLIRPDMEKAKTYLEGNLHSYYLDSLATGEVMSSAFSLTTSEGLKVSLIGNTKAFTGEYLRFDDYLQINKKSPSGKYNVVYRHPVLATNHQIRFVVGNSSRVVDLDYAKKYTNLGVVDFSVNSYIRIEPVGEDFIFDRIEFMKVDGSEGTDFFRTNLAGIKTDSVLEVEQPNMNAQGKLRVVSDNGIGSSQFHWYKNGIKVASNSTGELLFNDLAGSSAGSYHVEFESEVSMSSVKSAEVQVVPINAAAETLLQFQSTAAAGMILKVYYRGNLIAEETISFSDQTHNIRIPDRNINLADVTMEVVQ